MRNMKDILDKIKEKWVAGTKDDVEGEYREIFVNPSRSEIRDIEEYEGSLRGANVRFIAVKDSKNVYVSAGDVFHDTIVMEVKVFNDFRDILYNFSGTGIIDRGKIIVEEFSDYYDSYPKNTYKVCEDIFEGEYDWLERYNFVLDEIKDIVERDIDIYRDAELPY